MITYFRLPFRLRRGVGPIGVRGRIRRIPVSGPRFLKNIFSLGVHRFSLSVENGAYIKKLSTCTRMNS